MMFSEAARAAAKRDAEDTPVDGPAPDPVTREALRAAARAARQARRAAREERDRAEREAQAADDARRSQEREALRAETASLWSTYITAALPEAASIAEQGGESMLVVVPIPSWLQNLPGTFEREVGHIFEELNDSHPSPFSLALHAGGNEHQLVLRAAWDVEREPS